VGGGNHDSPSRLDAPREVLASLKVHVVGGLRADEESWDRCLCTVRGADDEVAVVVAAVPFVHEVRLGVRASLVDVDALRAAFRKKFAHLYTTLTDRALALGGGAPVVATGHLSCVGGEKGDAPVEIHLASSTDGLPAEVFDPRLAYVALGHFHRAFPVKGSVARYCGTPVPLGARESSTPRQVLLVDLPGEDGEVAVSPLEVPRTRDVLRFAGPFEQLLSTLQGLAWETPLPPLVRAEIVVDGYTPGLEARLLREAECTGGERPLLARVTQQPVGGTQAAEQEQAPVSLSELTEEEVFRRLVEAQGSELDEALLTAFRSLLTADEPEVRS